MSRLLVMLATMLLYACSDDAPADKDRQRHTIDVEVRPYAAWFQEEPISSFTRGFPEDYKDENDKEYKTFADMYGDEGNFKYQTDLIHATIDMYFTRTGSGTYTPRDPQFTQVYYSNQSKRWGTPFEIESYAYYLYGFMPEEMAEEGSSITSTEFENGAVLTLTKMSTITPNDVCVVVAAGSGNATGPSTGFAVGKFKYQTGGASDQNFIYLLFDHLYASMRFNFSVANSYNNLRTIKLKKLQLLSESMKKYVNATVTLEATNDGTSPITNVTFNSDDSYPLLDTGNKTNDGILFDNSDNPVELTTTPSSFLGCFLPGSGNEFILKSTYDVYDKAGNLIRENCKASNRLVLSDISSTITFGRGKMLAIELTVNPTYLYMLSDPDLDNPTITVN